jgi:hypothetical protein
MRRIGTRAARRRARQWTQQFSWLAGGALVCLGALAGAFGTVAWLTALCAPSLGSLLVGVLALGVAPVLGGGGLLWAGLGILEAHAKRGRVRALPEDQLCEATRGGASAAAVAERLGVSELREITERLDELAAREILSLEIREDGELIYAPRA